MRRLAVFVGAAALVPALSLGAQEMQHAQHGQQHGIGMASVKPLYESIKGFILRSAEVMPAEHFAFRPAEGVRTYGELLGHVANASYMFCATAKGEKSPSTTDFEKVTSREELQAGLRAAFEYCDSAYQMDEMKAMEETTMFGQKGSRLWVLNFNVAHDNEHYGNLVTYMRIKGVTPPSSQGR
jgi:uncharacterized damage-inducible protein DinB